MALSAIAAPATYHLQPDLPSVGFKTDFEPDKISGSMPVPSADKTLDFAHVSASKVCVTLSAAGFLFTAQTMKSPKVRDTAEFSPVAFTSASLNKAGQGTIIIETITIRDLPKPVSFHAEIYRQQGTVDGELSHLPPGWTSCSPTAG